MNHRLKAIRLMLYGALILCVMALVYFFNNWQAPKPNIALTLDQPLMNTLPRDPLAKLYPNIVIIALPKSGSEYLKQIFMDSLGYRRLHKEDWHNYSKIEGFANGYAMISKEHFAPNETNVKLLRKYTDHKIVVHVRDPRESLLSWVHHMNKEHIRTQGKSYNYGVPNDYYSWSLSDQIDWAIDNKLPEFLQWLAGWKSIKDLEDTKNDGLRILFTTYNDLLNNEVALFNKILAFYQIQQKDYVFKQPPKDSSVHYRRGDPNEWRSVYTQSQKNKITKMLSKDFLESFGWY